MKLWMSGEVEADIFEKFRKSIVEIERNINSIIELKKYFDKLDDWDVIAIIRDDDTFSEITKYSKKNKEMDFRLKIDYSEFKSADDTRAKELIFCILNRSLVILREKGLCSKSIQLLKKDLSQKVSNVFNDIAV